MSIGGRVTAWCECGASIKFWVVTAPDYRDDQRVYFAEGDGISGGPYFVDRNRPVNLPDPDDVPDEGFRLHSAHARWRLQCDRCERHPLVAKSIKLGRALYLAHAAGQTQLSLDELEALLSDSRIR